MKLKLIKRKLYRFKKPKLLYMNLEPTNCCNYACIMCHHKNMKRKQGFIDFDLFKHMINEMKINNIKTMSLGAYGEPLLHPKIIDILEYALDNDIDISFFSNASLLTKETSKKLLKLPIKKYTFSFEGNTKKTYEKVMYKGNFENAIKNIEEFLRLKEEYKNNAFVIIYSLAMPETDKELDGIIERWKNKVDAVAISNTVDYAGKVKHGTYMKWKTEKERPPCPDLWTGMTFLWNGDVTTCCVDFEGELVIGNIKEQSLKDIFLGEKMNELRKSHLKKEFHKIPVCDKCNNFLLITDEVRYVYNTKLKMKNSKGKLAIKL